MKIFTRIVIDMTSRRMLEADSFDYEGPVALGKDSGAVPVPPAPINPWEVVNAQVAGQPDILNPFYRRTHTGTPEYGDYTIAEEYSPDVMRGFESRNAIANAMLGNVGEGWMNFTGPSRDGSNQIDRLMNGLGRPDQLENRVNTAARDVSGPVQGRTGATNSFFNQRPDAPFEWDQDQSARVQDAHWQKQKGLLDQSFGEQGEQLDQKLANQGLPMGGEAYGEEMDRFEQGRSDAYTRAAQDAVQLGAQEDQRQFGQSLAERNQFNTDLSTYGQEESRRFGQGLSRLGGLQGLEGQRDAEDLNELGAAGNEQQRQYNMIASLMGMPGGGFIPTGGGGSVDPTAGFGLNQAGRNTAYQGAMAGYNAGVATDNANTSAAASIALAFF